VGHDIVQSGFQTTENVDELVDDAQRRIFDVAERRIKTGLVPVRDLVRPTFKIIEELQEKKSHVTGVPSDFPDLDNLTSGFQKSDLIIIASRPSMGKTSLALNIAQRAAIDHGLIVALFSLEMSSTQLMIRILSAEARVDSQALRKGFLDNEAMIDLTSAAGRIDEAPIYIDDTASLTVTEMKAKARRLHSERGLDLVIVDYLQLMQGRANAERRDLEVGEISRSLKGLAKELDVPVVALSQLRRAVEDRPGKRPQLSDLRESGAIEQDADVIIFIYREEMYHRHEDEGDHQSHEGVAEIIVGKQRNGPVGKIELTFIKKYSRFESRARGYDA
jgi:replicative DNA helicase